MRQPKRKTLRAILTVTYPGQREGSQVVIDLHNALNRELPADYGYALSVRNIALPPGLFLSLVACIHRQHPFRRGWEAALTGHARASLPVFQDPAKTKDWLEGWDLAMAYWPQLERKKYTDAKAALAAAPQAKTH